MARGDGAVQGLLEKILSKFADTAPRESDNARAYYQSREFEVRPACLLLAWCVRPAQAATMMVVVCGLQDLRRTAHSMKGSSVRIEAPKCTGDAS
jgi:hypothetical protein